jgi:hypothetical protein
MAELHSHAPGGIALMTCREQMVPAVLTCPSTLQSEWHDAQAAELLAPGLTQRGDLLSGYGSDVIRFV